MPLYEYRCPTCRATFEALRPFRDADTPIRCPAAHKGATRVVSLVAGRTWSGSAGGQAPSGCACGGGSCGCGH